MPVMDTLIWHDLGYKSQQKDIVEYKAQIASKNTQISLLRNNEYDLKEQVMVQKMLADNYKASAVAFQDKYSKEKDRSSRRGKIIIGSVSVNLVFIAGLIVALR